MYIKVSLPYKVLYSLQRPRPDAGISVKLIAYKFLAQDYKVFQA